MLYTYEWVDGWIDKQTVKLCCKLHSTRRVYNLDLIKLILKNTTDIIFFLGSGCWFAFTLKNRLLSKHSLASVCAMLKMLLLCSVAVYYLFIEKILDEMERERGMLKPLLHSVAHIPSPPQLHDMSPVQRTAAYIWDSIAKIQASEEL